MEGKLVEDGEKTTPCFCSGKIIFVHERNDKAIQEYRDIPSENNCEEEEKSPSHDEEY